MKEGGVIYGSRALGFFTVMLILTLDASSGKDLLDVLVPYIEAQTQQLTH